MRRACLIVIVLLVLPYVVAAQTASSPVLSARDIADGRLMLFDGETNYGWQTRSASDWLVDGGAFASTGAGGVLATTTEFADFELRAEYWADPHAMAGVVLRAPVSGRADGLGAYLVELNSGDPWERSEQGTLAKRGVVRKGPAGRWASLRIVANGTWLLVEIDGKRALSGNDLRGKRGVIALVHHGAGLVRFRNITLNPMNLKPFFNGKDLTGWSAVPGLKSEFAVTPDGCLNIKKGPGDIQTTGTWGDFVLQSDVFTNGNHLNSGIFFRGNPGKRWEGYEMQVMSFWHNGDRTKPWDYGTGAIYNRQEVRKVVSNDREWYTATIVAHGYHIATWINGYQVTDFTDTRPVDETNARNGARKAPGIISLQGHDPTTDVSFRNLRVVEMPPAAP